jgi:hypothetical protein
MAAYQPVVHAWGLRKTTPTQKGCGTVKKAVKVGYKKLQIWFFCPGGRLINRTPAQQADMPP